MRLLISLVILQFFLMEISARLVIDTCKPNPKPSTPQHIIGYGSLMSSASKNRTYPDTSPNFPIEVKGFQRLWNCKGVSPTLSTTYLGVIRDPKSSFNAAYFTLDNGEQGIKDFDTRESFYCRKELELDEFTLLAPTDGNKTLEGQFWIYVTKPEFSEAPTAEYPIVQSYMDTWLTGCFEMEEKFGLNGFAERCVQSTGMWSEHWVNDRIYPRRPFLFTPKASSIDRLLNSTVHGLWTKAHSASGSLTTGIWHIILVLAMGLGLVARSTDL